MGEILCLCCWGLFWCLCRWLFIRQFGCTLWISISPSIPRFLHLRIFSPSSRNIICGSAACHVVSFCLLFLCRDLVWLLIHSYCGNCETRGTVNVHCHVPIFHEPDWWKLANYYQPSGNMASQLQVFPIYILACVSGSQLTYISSFIRSFLLERSWAEAVRRRPPGS